MKILWLAPFNIHLEPVIAGLKSLPGHETEVVWFERFGHQVDSMVIDAADKIRPDLIIYTGQNGGIFPSLDCFLRLKRRAPIVMIAHDASDATWTQLLEQYEAANAFTAIVNIDGSDKWPRREVDFTCLTPTDPEFYV